MKRTILLLTGIFLIALSAQSYGDENKELNFFTGMFDFSDDKQAAVLFGFQHQNENL